MKYKISKYARKHIETPVNEAELRSAEIVYEKRKDKYHKTTIEKIGDLGNYFVDNYIRPIKMLFVSQK